MERTANRYRGALVAALGLWAASTARAEGLTHDPDPGPTLAQGYGSPQAKSFPGSVQGGSTGEMTPPGVVPAPQYRGPGAAAPAPAPGAPAAPTTPTTPGSSSPQAPTRTASP